MSIERLLRWLVIAIVLVVAVSLFDWILDLAGWLLEIAVPVLLVLLAVAVVLRFFGYWQKERRR